MTAALHYAAGGFRIARLWSHTDGRCDCADRATCSAAGKHPHLSGWQNKATDDPDTLRHWLEPCPSAGLGAVLDGLTFVVDIDPRNRGDESFAALLRKHGALPETLTHRTGGGGLHYFLRAPGAVKSRDGIAPGVDILGRGKLVVLPPSHHASGNNYRVELDAPIANAPPWLLTIVDIERPHKSEAPRFSQGSGAQKARALSESEAGPVPEGRRRDVLLSELGRLWNRATFTATDAYTYAENYQRTRCAPGTRPFTIADARKVATFIIGTTKKTHATPAPSSSATTETRRELTELLALSERIDWRAIAKKWATTNAGGELKRPGDVTRAGTSLRHVYATALGIANERDTLTPALAVREVAERGRMSKTTVGAHMRTLRLAGLLRLSESWGQRTRATQTGEALAASYTVATVAEVCSTGTVPPTGGGARICTRRANFPSWLLATRALGRHAPRALAALERGEWQSGRALGRALGISDAPMSRLLGLFERYGLAERLGKRGWRRGPVALTDLAEHQDDRLTAARRAAEAQRHTHRAEREAAHWRHRLATAMGEAPKPSKLVLVPGSPETGETDRTKCPRSDARRPGQPSAWGKNGIRETGATATTEFNPPDDRAEHGGGGR